MTTRASGEETPTRTSALNHVDLAWGSTIRRETGSALEDQLRRIVGDESDLTTAPCDRRGRIDLVTVDWPQQPDQ